MVLDTALIVAVLTAGAYFFGYQYIFIREDFIGLSYLLHLDLPIQVVLMHGGRIIVVSWCLFVVAQNIKRFKGRELWLFPNPAKNNLPLCVGVFIILCWSVCYWMAWQNADRVLERTSRIREITFSPGLQLTNINELGYLGHSGSCIVLRRMEGVNPGEIILVADADVKLVKMQRRE